jgi:putative ABC transport system permease protein
MASVGYFSTLKIPLLRGRDFQTSDSGNAPGVAVISEEAAREFWHGDDALGQRIDVGPRDQPFEIVGIVGNVTTSFSRFAPTAEFYLPLAQGYLLFPFQPDLTLIARGAGEPGALVPALRGALHRVNPDLPLFQIHSMQEQLERAEPEQRFLARVLLLFAALATILCAAGIYAQAAYAATSLTRELGIRLALGAQPREVFQMVLRRSTVMAAAGLVIGFGAAIGLTRLLTSMLFEVSPLDGLTFVSVGVIFMLVVLLACLVPALRAMRVDPMVALRHE